MGAGEESVRLARQWPRPGPRSIAGIIGLAVLAALLLWTIRNRTGSPLSLVDAYPQTLKRSTYSQVEAFSVYDADIGGVTRRAVYARPPSRITWRVTPPRRSKLQAWLALRSDSWTRSGDGVVFRIGVSDGQKYRELLNQHINPSGNPDDRRWIGVTVDLKGYWGKSVDIIFNTDVGVPGTPADTRGDLALWGEPSLVTPR